MKQQNQGKRDVYKVTTTALVCDSRKDIEDIKFFVRCLFVPFFVFISGANTDFNTASIRSDHTFIDKMMEIPSSFRDGGGSSSLGVYSLSSPSPTSSSNSPAGNMFRGGSLSPTQSPTSFEVSPLSSPHMLLRRSSSNPSPAHSLKAAHRPLSKNRPRKNVKKARKGLIYLKLNLKDSVASGLINPINKVQLSILNTGIIKINDEVSKASGIIPKKPFDLNKNKFDKHLELFNQYKVLLDIEYHVSIFQMLLLTLNSCKPVTHSLSLFLCNENRWLPKTRITLQDRQ